VESISAMEKGHRGLHLAMSRQIGT